MKLIDAYQELLRDLGNKKGQNTSGIVHESKKTVKTSDELTFRDKVSPRILISIGRLAAASDMEGDG
jgi:hypothetical protein